MPLGLFSHTTFEATILALQPGDAVLVVTKGVTGSRRGGTEFGVQRVTRTLRNTTAASASAICEVVLHEAHDFAHHPWSRFLSVFHKKKGCNEDDLTALALRNDFRVNTFVPRSKVRFAFAFSGSGSDTL